MKPTKILIESLLSAADRIEFGTDYNWAQYDRCNCGMLAQELLHIDQEELYGKILNGGVLFASSWRSSTKDRRNFCHITGRPISGIFQELHKHGLEKGDFDLIENAGLTCPLASPEIEQRADPKFVANFFRELAAKLQEQRKVKA